MKVEASAPANIALIKYMGKTALNGNLPTNASLSYTLEHMRSFVTIEPGFEATDRWQPMPGLPELNLSVEGRRKFLAHLARLKREWNIAGTHVVSSANNFPADAGLASSASSFAALTLATWELAKRLGDPRALDLNELSRQSRLGSGSSCRSFYSPWALWRDEGAEAVALNLHLQHAVVIVGDEKKSVSSSAAHQRVNTSLLFAGRSARAEIRLSELMAALHVGDWAACFELCWSEFFDMHSLFETSRPSFGYFTEGTFLVLQRMRQVWQETGDGPLVTMDAGANVHLLLRPEQTTTAATWLADMNILKSWE